jgi:hypothetical protein
MTSGAREKESASRALEEADIAEEQLTYHTEANLLALIRLTRGSPTCFSADPCDKNCASRTNFWIVGYPETGR